MFYCVFELEEGIEKLLEEEGEGPDLPAHETPLELGNSKSGELNQSFFLYFLTLFMSCCVFRVNLESLVEFPCVMKVLCFLVFSNKEGGRRRSCS